MGNEAALRERYAVMETDALSTMWRDEERMPWAESILRDELLARGVAAAELDDISGRREQIARDAPPKVSDTLFGWGVLGRLGTFFVAFGASRVAGALFGTRAAVVAAFIVVAVYAGALFVRVGRQLKQPTGTLASFAMIWQTIEAGLILLALGGAGFFVRDEQLRSPQFQQLPQVQHGDD